MNVQPGQESSTRLNFIINSLQVGVGGASSLDKLSSQLGAHGGDELCKQVEQLRAPPAPTPASRKTKLLPAQVSNTPLRVEGPINAQARPSLCQGPGPFNAPPTVTVSTPGVMSLSRRPMETRLTGRRCRAVGAKEEVSWGSSDGPGLEPGATSASASASGAAAAAAAAEEGAGVSARVEEERVSWRESPVPEHRKLWAGVLQVG